MTRLLRRLSCLFAVVVVCLVATSSPTFFLGEIRPDGELLVLKKRINGLQPYETFRDLLTQMVEKTRLQGNARQMPRESRK
jgi:hypothetical protein